jgi:hypothetical protein
MPILKYEAEIWARTKTMRRRKKGGEFKECHLEKQMTKYGGMDTIEI